ncbi:hypothetical protein ESCO_003963 [Escovopsis weberi]|uniref:Right handed beta helix domain-containing protein n=1 Tax=Escovopsis weberi TaxID=150374 RepID=A0A0M8NA82_ESCWE|nr:hypothetical protein ESCO_003963 [Escovopsis weberi]
MKVQSSLLSVVALPALSAAACLKSGDQNTINQLFQKGGRGTVVQICQDTTIQITDVIKFSADDQEISTKGYPMGSSRATIQIAPGNTASTMITGRYNDIRIKNIQLDGNRPNAGIQHNGGANIEIGGEGKGQIVQYTASRNPRGWSCLHVIGSGNADAPCANATIRDNDIGPCGQSGVDENGNGRWADGVSLDCTSSLVQNNTIDGPTDGGIVVFGSPHSLIDSNTIISSEEYLGFGAINLVDGEYNGSYAGVVVSNNVIKGRLIFNLGIGIGANVWSFNDPFPLQGCAYVLNNSFSGSVAFPIAVNGWTDGLTIADNDASGVTTPKSDFSDATSCGKPIQDLFNANANFVYDPQGISGPHFLQPEFVASDGNITNFLCTSTTLPSQLTMKPGVDLQSNTALAKLKGVTTWFQGDNNIVVYDANGKPLWASGSTIDGGCGSPSECELQFDESGNLTTYYQGKVRFSTNTGGLGKLLQFKNTSPWVEIQGADGAVVWDTVNGLAKQ